MKCTVCEKSHGFAYLYTISGYALNQIFPTLIDFDVQEMVVELPFHVCNHCLDSKQVFSNF
jgi:hypothetical protein